MSARGLLLTARDQELLALLAECGTLTTAQIGRQLFASEQTTLRRLRKLEQAGYLHLSRSPAAAHRIVALAPKAQMAGAVKANGSHVRKAASPLFLQHTLGVNDFHLALRRACRSHGDVELLGFVCDRSVRKQTMRGLPQRMLCGVLGPGGHVPDGAFALRRAGKCALFFFELDRGTEVVGNQARGVGRIIHSYVQGFTSRAYQGLACELGLNVPPQGFRALIVTTSPARVASIRETWGKTSGPAQVGRRFIWLAPMTVLASADILRAGWFSLEAGDTHTYSVVGA